MTLKKRNEKRLPPMFKEQLLAHALGGYKGHTYLNTEECFFNAIQSGYKYFEVDLKLTTDGYLVCSHGWNKQNCDITGMKYDESFENMTYELFMSQKILGMPVMDAKRMYQLLVEHTDIYLELDLHSLNYNTAKVVATKLIEIFEDKSVLERCLIQVNSIRMFKGIKSVYNFPIFQYVLIKDIDDLDMYIDFCVENDINSLAIKKTFATPQNIRSIKDAGLGLLVFSVDNVNTARMLFGYGVDTVCTNFITPSDLYDSDVGITVIYNSSPKASEEISVLIGRNILRGSISITKNGSYEYTEDLVYVTNEGYNLMDCCFSKKGACFAGWNVRYRENKHDKWKWLCTDSIWRTREEIERTDSVAMTTFYSGDKFKKEMLPEGNTTFVFQARWKTQTKNDLKKKIWSNILKKIRKC